MHKINLSFKEQELSLFLFVKNQLSPSIYIKSLILEDMRKKEIEKNKESVK